MLLTEPESADGTNSWTRVIKVLDNAGDADRSVNTLGVRPHAMRWDFSMLKAEQHFEYT